MPRDGAGPGDVESLSGGGHPLPESPSLAEVRAKAKPSPTGARDGIRRRPCGTGTGTHAINTWGLPLPIAVPDA